MCDSKTVCVFLICLIDFLPQEVKEWRKEFRQLLDRFSEDLEFRNDATLSLEVLFTEKDKIDSKLHTLKSEIDTLKSERKRLNDSKRSMNNLIDQSSLGQISLAPDRCRRCTFLEWKVSESLVELRQMNNIVHETEAKCAKFGKIAVDTQKLCTETKQELADLQTHFLAERKMMAISNCDGHLIWCISEFSSKLKHAKERNIVINSPIFCNQQYGYTLRVSQFSSRNRKCCDIYRIISNLKNNLFVYFRWMFY